MKTSGKKYYNITRREMEKFLFPRKFRLLNEPTDLSRQSWSPDLRIGYKGKEVSELVYGCRVKPINRRMTIRVYSGIWLSGESRDVGEDAIRVCVVWLDPELYECGLMEYPEIKGVGSEKRVHRIPTWATNLEERLSRWEECLGPMCSCGKPMQERHKKNDASSKFWGCTGYPNCKETKRFK